MTDAKFMERRKTQYTNLPSLLKKEGLFCLWQYETRDGKKTKVPYCIRGYRADPETKIHFQSLTKSLALPTDMTESASVFLMTYAP